MEELEKQLEKKIVEEARLISEFMGYQIVNNDILLPLGNQWFYNTYEFSRNRGTIYNDIPYYRVKLSESEFYRSFDWSMAVLMKIESLGYRWEIGMSADSPYHYCKIWSIDKVEGVSAEDAVYGAICEFIKWYNEWKSNLQVTK